MPDIAAALQGAQYQSPLKAPSPPASLLVAGGGGTLGAAVLAEALAGGRFQCVMALVEAPLASALRGFVPVLPQQAVVADSAVVVFERSRHSNGRDAAFVQPAPADLLPLAQRLKHDGVRRLVVLLPHAPALLPQALRHGLATLDEGAVAALGFEQLVFVRTAQRLSPADGSARGLQRFAGWWLSQLNYMVPQREQPVRAVVLARAVVQLLRLLPAAPPATRVLAPEHLALGSGDAVAAEAAVRAWLLAGAAPSG